MSPRRKQAAESRYVWCFAALLAGALLLCAPLVLVTATADPDNAWLGPDPLTAPPAFAGEGWDTVVTMEAVARYDEADLPPAIPLAPSTPDFTAWLAEAIPDLHTLAAESAPHAREPAPETVQTAALDEALTAESSGASVTYSSEPDPQPVAQKTETLSEPVQVAELDAADHAPAQKLEEEEMPQDVKVSEPDAPADGDDDSTSSIKPLPGAAPDITPPLPMRRPATPIKTAEIVVTQEAQEPSARKPVSRTERRDDSPPPQRWRPMALAPADADTPAPPKLSPPASKLSQGAYQSKVWSALARAKPRAGQRGSATVTFSIGANGALRGARVAKSSGNAKIDRMALATVRKAGPFPPPPVGATSYNIRIDFH